VNNDKGVKLQAGGGGKKKPSMEACFYGDACTRPNCIYRHDVPANGAGAGAKKSTEPCMAFLAGQCVFTVQQCRNRHPGKPEVETLRAKYATIRCRHGVKCQTTGCLYIHPGDVGDTPFGEPAHVAFPPLASTGTGTGTGVAANADSATASAQTTPAVAGSAWRPAPVATAWSQQAPSMNTNTVMPVSAPVPASAVPTPVPVTATPQAPLPPPPPPTAWGQKSNSITPTYASTAANPQQAPPVSTTTATASTSKAAAAAPLNIKAKEWVPGGGTSFNSNVSA
jgi:hypothetical protein